MNASLKKTLFIEVSLMKQKINEQPTEDEETKQFIGGQLLTRVDSNPGFDGMSVIFRKVKILTTTMQQRGKKILRIFRVHLVEISLRRNVLRSQVHAEVFRE